MWISALTSAVSRCSVLVGTAYFYLTRIRRDAALSRFALSQALIDDRRSLPGNATSRSAQRRTLFFSTPRQPFTAEPWTARRKVSPPNPLRPRGLLGPGAGWLSPRVEDAEADAGLPRTAPATLGRIRAEIFQGGGLRPGARGRTPKDWSPSLTSARRTSGPAAQQPATSSGSHWPRASGSLR